MDKMCESGLDRKGENADLIVKKEKNGSKCDTASISNILESEKGW